MKEFLDSLFSRYGMKAISSILIIALLIWGSAHSMSAPGSSVKVLWGLVEYTKPTKLNTPTSLAETKVKRTLGDKHVTSPARSSIAIEIQSVIKDGVEIAKTTLRESHDLRALSVLESGKKVADSANRTYFFTLDAWLNFVEGDFESGIQRLTSQANNNDLHLEIQRGGDSKLFLVGFVGESDAANSSQLDGVSQVVIVFSQVWHPNFQTLIRVPASRINSANHRRIDISDESSLSVLDLVLQ